MIPDPRGLLPLVLLTVLAASSAGHCPMETHPAEFLAHLLPFLREGREAQKP